MIVNHLYWAVQNCNENGEELAERFNSVIHHIVNRHEFPGQHYTSCPPHDNPDAYDWLTEGSGSHEANNAIETLSKYIEVVCAPLTENLPS